MERYLNILENDRLLLTAPVCCTADLRRCTKNLSVITPIQEEADVKKWPQSVQGTRPSSIWALYYLAEYVYISTVGPQNVHLKTLIYLSTSVSAYLACFYTRFSVSSLHYIVLFTGH